MSTGFTPDSVAALDWFLTGYSARDLAEPLLSLDEGCTVETARQVLSLNRAEVLGIRSGGVMRGWVDADRLKEQFGVVLSQPFDPATVVADATPLNEVVCLLHAQPRLFVRAFGHVAGVLARSTLEKPPLRMWLFGLITISEQRVTQVIEETFPGDAWQTQLSAGRLVKARELQTLRQSRGQQPALLDCLQFADKGQIVARNESLRNRTRFNSRSEVERFVQALQDLRNNLAHAQDISGDLDVIHELAANVHQIICGRRE